MENSSITVILPHYNHRAYLYESVQSIIDQTYTNWSLLILNDEPGLDLFAYEMLDYRIKVYSDDKRIGQAARLNQGIKLADSDYIAFHDADDISIPQRFRLSLNYILNNEVLYGDGIALLKNGTKEYVESPEASLELLKKRSLGCFASTIVKAEFAKKTLFDENIGYGNDRVWWIKVLQNGGDVIRLPLPIYYYRNYTSNFRINSFNKLQTLKARIHKKKLDKELQKYVDNIW